MNRSIRLLAPLLALLLIAVGCGNEAVVVTGPGTEPSTADNTPDLADSAGETSDAGSTAGQDEGADDGEGFTFDPSLIGGDDAQQSDDTEGSDERGVPEGESAGAAGLAMLRQAATDTQAVDSYRFEVAFGMEVAVEGTEFSIPTNPPLTTGAVVGDRTWMLMDMGPMFDAIFEAAGGGGVVDLLGDDLSMEMLTEGSERLYIRAPLFGTLSSLGALPGADGLDALTDGWGVVDLTAATGLAPDEIGALTGAQTGASADALLAMLDQLGGDVREIGAAEIRGAATTHFRAEIDLGQVLEAQGMTASDFQELAGGVDLTGIVLPLDVFVDTDSRIRRISIVLDLQVIAGLVGEAPPAGSVMRFESVIDIFDFGAPIDLVDTATLGAVDVTDAFVALAGY